MKSIYKLFVLILAAVSLTGCDVEEYPNLNSPDLDNLLEDPTLGDIQDLVGGMQAGMRNNIGGYLDNCGVIGREYYRFATSDPRFTSDLLGKGTAVLDNNTFYITNPWAARYRVVKNALIVLEAVDITKSDITEEEKNGIRGFANTIRAYELLLNLNLTYQNGIRIETSDPDNLGPVVGYEESLNTIQEILASAATELDAAGDDFAFVPSTGFEGLIPEGGDHLSPADFIKFNKAIAARVAAYRGDMPAVSALLGDSFLDVNGDLQAGAYYVFSADGNDVFNPMFFAQNSPASNARIAHPTFLEDAEAGDERLSKVTEREESLTLDNLTGDYDFFVYTSNVSSIPIIRNEELVLLYAEANYEANPAEAINAINVVRNAAGLPDYSGGMGAAELLDEILMQRRYSLYGEGHRWIDMRRYNRLGELPTDRAEDDVWEQFPIPLNENVE
ncbi:RagB/SusD family nutrient uptake outer membrane protein [Sinomicrobium weinanense]|uniref:RagB/SusD family nutrient uptake outer membrane protein n=1 Tax=Sinomicrobium weinanense TaxID=2842200 RepID=A0A926Q2G8_9FLAO|nr:RagB/SusD family nutrient uptake outer membrane protein [Sinomicrobium weinanense]MBC9794906.1 RagB/SusD family nutrient uptake outer membrane protein [Sinomicrobium weinanense]MBU3125677.1 RagB/SusD family nutrient uptake outer membrane protein [Sinomicrobium weinanense]